MSENLEQNLNDKVSKQVLEKNLNENFSQSARENLSKNSSQAAPKCKAQNFFKNALELSLQGVADALIYAGKAGVWLSNASNCLKDEAQRAELSLSLIHI